MRQQSLNEIGELCRARIAYIESSIMGNALARPGREPKSRLQIEEGDCAVFKLLFDDTLSFQPSPSR
jgi:hypothetical protein